jgi:catechol 2,3-dioxygenase-like lactoylglutathione lyase family enzyme
MTSRANPSMHPTAKTAVPFGSRRAVRAGIRFITFPIEDVMALAQTLDGRGVKPVWGPAPPRPESLATLLFVEDPDGNWVEFYSIRKQPQ